MILGAATASVIVSTSQISDLSGSLTWRDGIEAHYLKIEPEANGLAKITFQAPFTSSSSQLTPGQITTSPANDLGLLMLTASSIAKTSD